MKTKILSINIFILACLFIFACSKESPVEPVPDIFEVQGDNGFVGTLNGTDAFIALLIAEDETIVYLCNGDEDITEWFASAISDPTKLSLTNGAGAKVSGTFTGDSFDGEVTLPNGNKHVFSATTNTGGVTGIFRIHGDEAFEDEVVGGWVVNSIGEDRGSVRVGSKKLSVSFGTISDGTSNTLLIGQKSYPVGHWLLNRSVGSASIIAPNN